MSNDITHFFKKKETKPIFKVIVHFAFATFFYCSAFYHADILRYMYKKNESNEDGNGVGG